MYWYSLLIAQIGKFKAKEVLRMNKAMLYNASYVVDVGGSMQKEQEYY